jgi:glycosyltransferase involved in cell wall biosynthesis
VLDAACGAADYAWFRRRMPDRVETLLTAIGNAAGLSRDVLERHEHLLHAFSFARAVEAWGPDYLHSYFFYERTLFALVASKLLDIPRGVSCYADHQLDDYPLKIVPLHLRTSDVIVATSQRIRGELEVIHGGSLSALLVKPNAIDVSGSPPRPSRPIAPPSPVQLICVCRIDPKKGLEFLIDAVRRLIDDGLDVRLQVVGVPDGHSPAAGAYHDALRSQVDRLGLDHAIRFAGRRTSQEVGELLRRADVFVAPFVELACGDKDGISTAVLEAMSVGCAIVATDAGSLAEVIRDGHDGLLVPQRDSAALAAAIQRLAADAALSDRLGTAAAARVRREFNTATCETPFHERILRTIETPRGTAAPAEVRT